MAAAPVSTSSGVIGWVLFAVTLVGSSIIITILVVCLVVLRQQSVKQKRYNNFAGLYNSLLYKCRYMGTCVGMTPILYAHVCSSSFHT